LISAPFSESSVAAVKDLIVFIRFYFLDIVPAHIHLRTFDPLFLDNFKGFDSNNFIFTGFFKNSDNFYPFGDVIEYQIIAHSVVLDFVDLVVCDDLLVVINFTDKDYRGGCNRRSYETNGG
jgi:hypothetical protein